MKRIILSLSLAMGFSAAHADPSDVAGYWLTEAGNAVVEIADCGDGTPCGNIAWFDQTDAEANTDIYNPDAALRDRSILGLQLLWGFSRRNDRWRRGKIYDPEEGKTYGSGIRINDEGELKVKGCIGPLCQTQTWTRVAPDDVRLAVIEGPDAP